MKTVVFFWLNFYTMKFSWFPCFCKACSLVVNVLYITILRVLCQLFSKLFFNFFSAHSRLLRRSLFVTAWLYYHLSLTLSTTFLNFFPFSLYFFCFSICRRFSILPQTLIAYFLSSLLYIINAPYFLALFGPASCRRKFSTCDYFDLL